MIKRGWTIFGVAMLCALPGMAEMQFKEGHWRLELTNAFGVHSGSVAREGDWLVTGTVEYEFPASSRMTLGLRMLPLFLYTQDATGDCRDRRRLESDLSGETVWGAGAGLALRVYQKKDAYRGLFAEVSTAAIGHKNKLNGNSANLNFLSGIGVGYQFKSQWHALVKWEHLSNAGLGEHNPGANTVGLAIGYSF